MLRRHAVREFFVDQRQFDPSLAAGGGASGAPPLDGARRLLHGVGRRVPLVAQALDDTP